MLRKTLIVIYVAFLILFFNQNKILSKDYEIKFLELDNFFMAPKASPSGKYVAFSSLKYKGIFVYDLINKKLRMLTDEDFAGYNFVWSEDEKFIYYRFRRGLKFGIVKISLSGSKTELTPLLRELSFPIKNLGCIFTLVGRERKFHSLENKCKTVDSYLFAKDDKIYLYSKNRITQISDYKDKYFLPQFSPDRKWILYNGLVTGIHIFNIQNGKDLNIDLGSDPTWLPNSKAIIYEKTTDDGERILSSDIYLYNLSTKKISIIAETDNIIELHPQYDSVNKCIWFDSNGKIGYIKINL